MFPFHREKWNVIKKCLIFSADTVSYSSGLFFSVTAPAAQSFEVCAKLDVVNKVT